MGLKLKGTVRRLDVLFMEFKKHGSAVKLHKMKPVMTEIYRGVEVVTTHAHKCRNTRRECDVMEKYRNGENCENSGIQAGDIKFSVLLLL